MNWLKDKLETHSFVSGIWLASGSTVATEIAAVAGFDWALLDLEHGLFGESELLGLFQALARAGTAPVVRVPSRASDLIKKALDYGASGIMAPMISRAEEAKAFVSALRYPPAGTRGLTRSSRAANYGDDFPGYFRQANARIAGIGIRLLSWRCLSIVLPARTPHVPNASIEFPKVVPRQIIVCRGEGHGAFKDGSGFIVEAGQHQRPPEIAQDARVVLFER